MTGFFAEEDISQVPEISAMCSYKVMAEYGEKYLGELFVTS